MSSLPLISVVMPAYQAAEHIERAVQSILAQTFGGWELVALDDGSSDETPDILARFAASDSRIRPIRLSHVGIAAALNQGIAAARGEWIARMDADDRMLPRRLQAQLEFAASHPDLALTGCLVRLVSEMPPAREPGMQRFVNWANALVTPRDIAREMFVDCPVPHPSFFVRREFLVREGGYTLEDEPEDYELVLRLHARGLQFGKIPETLLEWTDRPGRASRTRQTYGLERFRALKARYLRQTGALERGFYLWGAGSVGKKLLLALQAEGLNPAALVDIDPDRIGQTIHGCRVISPDELLSLRSPGETVLGAVGTPGAREDIRRFLSGAGLREPEDFFFAA
jgi:glycosyltransferase involved in cell wall biosynthesis